MKTNGYSTKDLYEAATLYTLNITFLGLERDGQICWFNFANDELCKKTADAFWSRKVKVDAKSYAEAIRTLKDRIFARN